MKFIRKVLAGAVALSALAGGSAYASLTAFQSYVGTYGVSTDGFGSVSQSGTISADVPVGATVVAAYLYTSTFSNPTLAGIGGTLAGNPVAYAPLPLNPTACCSLRAARADVTGIVKPLVDGGPGGVYNFAITETDGTQDGEALVVVYSLASLPTSTVGILDGFSDVLGDTTSINFADPLNPAAPGFFAEMRLGIGFSCCSQMSSVTVNGTKITDSAGNNDDGVGAISNGQLFTMGGYDDPFSALLPTYADDHERYDLTGQITAGDTSIKVDTINPSQNDNIFLAVFHVLGEAGINEPPPRAPEPLSLALAGLALAGLGAQRRYAKRA